MSPPCRLYRRCEPGDGLETTDRCQPCNYGWYSQSHLTGPACPSLLSGSPHYFCCDTSLSPLLIIIPPPPPTPPASLRGDQHHHHLLQAATRNRYRQTMYKRVRKSIKAERIYTLIHGLHPTIETRALI